MHAAITTLQSTLRGRLMSGSVYTVVSTVQFTVVVLRTYRMEVYESIAYIQIPYFLDLRPFKLYKIILNTVYITLMLFLLYSQCSNKKSTIVHRIDE